MLRCDAGRMVGECFWDLKEKNGKVSCFGKFNMKLRIVLW